MKPKESSWMTHYNTIMYILTKVAMSARDLTDTEKDRLDFIAEHGGITIEEIAASNGCVYSDSWDDIIDGLRN